MTRNDSILYSGLTSKSSGQAERAKREKELKLEAKQQKRTKLIPAVEVVLDELEKEKRRTQEELIGMITVDTTEQATKDIIVALNLYSESVTRLKNRLSNIMRVKNV